MEPPIKEARRRRQRKTSAMPATDNEIKEKYLERAIRELNQLSRDLKSCEACSRTKVMPVLGSGHPQADIFLLKYAPTVSEIEEGVAFYGRAGNALMKSFKRLNIDPTVVYGTICAKCPVDDPAEPTASCIGRVADEFNIVKPRIIVRDGRAGRADHQRTRRSRWPGRSRPMKARSRPSPPPATRCSCPTSTTRSTKRAPSAASGGPSAPSAAGTTTSRLTERAGPARGGPGGSAQAGAAARASSVIGSTLAEARPRTTITSSAE